MSSTETVSGSLFSSDPTSCLALLMPRLRNLVLPNGLGQFPGHDFFDGLCLRLIENAFLLQEVVNARP
jgi:hypothetical protein